MIFGRQRKFAGWNRKYIYRPRLLGCGLSDFQELGGKKFLENIFTKNVQEIYVNRGILLAFLESYGIIICEKISCGGLPNRRRGCFCALSIVQI